MTLSSYQVFRAVANVGSFQKAADILGLTPSAISHTISSLEKELGFALLTRSRGGVTLTSYGEQLLPYVNAVLNTDESLQQAVSELNGLQQGRVRIGTFSSVCTNWIPEIIRGFQEKYGRISIEVYEGTYDDLYYWIRNGIVDFGFLSVSGARDLSILPLYRDPLVCVFPKGGRKRQSREPVTVEELRDYHFVSQRESTDADIQNFMRENALSISSDYHVVDDLSTVALVKNGFGICLMPELVMRDIPYDVECYPLDVDAARIIGLAAEKPEFMAPAVRAMYRYIIAGYQQDWAAK